MENKYGLYRGRPIEDYGKEELIQIIQFLDFRWRTLLEQHEKDLEFFVRR